MAGIATSHQQHSNAPLSRAFFMERVPSPSKLLIYRKKLIQPINLTNRNSIDFLSISGFKNWASPFVSKMLDNKFDVAEFTITVTEHRMDENNDSITLIAVPSVVFTLNDISRICDSVQKLLIQHNFNPSRIYFNMSEDSGFLSFEVFDESLSVSFSPFLCRFFGFDINELYTFRSKQKIFFNAKSFRDFRCDSVGIAVDLCYNQDLCDTVEKQRKRYEIVSLLDTRDINYCAPFKKTLLSQPEHHIFKSLSCHYLEIRFIDLGTGQLLSSFLPNSHEDEIYVKISFC